jgi:hypothetical protein
VSNELAIHFEELNRLEPIFHTAATGPERHKYEPLIAVDFWEIGASGKRYDRETVLKTLAEREIAGIFEQLSPEDFDCAVLEANCFLVRYLLRQGPRVTRRASIWKRTNVGWQIAYHQGTIVQ